MVTDGGASYAAKKDVPANTALTNTEYWQKLVDTVAGVEIGDTATYATTELLFNPEGTNEGRRLGVRVERLGIRG